MIDLLQGNEVELAKSDLRCIGGRGGEAERVNGLSNLNSQLSGSIYTI